MATTSSPAKESSQEDANITHLDPNVLSDDEEDQIFSQLINRYNDDSMFSTSLLDNSSFENTSSYQSNIDDDTIYTQSRDNNNMAETENTDSTITQNLRTYLEKECFPETEWTSELLFNASMDRANFQIMNVTKYVGNS